MAAFGGPQEGPLGAGKEERVNTGGKDIQDS